MLRSLLVLLVALLAIYLVKRVLGRPRPSGTPPRARTERMVECVHCGLNVPESEALSQGAQYFCCEAHRREHLEGRA